MNREEAKKLIDMSVEPYRYYDKNGNEVHDGDTIMLFGRAEKVALLDDEIRLGTDATNRSWIESGRAFPFEYGAYPLNLDDMAQAELVK